jgi:hypothetical protein
MNGAGRAERPTPAARRARQAVDPEEGRPPRVRAPLALFEDPLAFALETGFVRGARRADGVTLRFETQADPARSARVPRQARSPHEAAPDQKLGANCAPERQQARVPPAARRHRGEAGDDADRDRDAQRPLDPPGEGRQGPAAGVDGWELDCDEDPCALVVQVERGRAPRDAARKIARDADLARGILPWALLDLDSAASVRIFAGIPTTPGASTDARTQHRAHAIMARGARATGAPPAAP